jgi:flagellar hook assembly protein FlgD
VQIEVYNIRGAKINTLISGNFRAGQHSVVWKGKDNNGNNVSSGVYFYKMTTPEFSSVKKMILMK